MSSTPTVDPAATQSASELEKSRAKSRDARDRLEAARSKLADVDGEIGRITAQSSSDETALRSALDEVKRLKKALKDGERQRQKLVTARKRAEDAAAKAEEKVHKAEAKYDRAVLADLIQRQKENDREAASGKAASGKSAENGSTATASPTAVTSIAPSPGSTESEDLGTATARATAARTTARRAPTARGTARTRTNGSR